MVLTISCSIRLTIRPQSGFGKIELQKLRLKETVRGFNFHILCVKGDKSLKCKSRTHTSLGLGIRNIHATNHDDPSRRLIAIVRETDRYTYGRKVMLNTQPKTEDSLRSINEENFCNTLFDFRQK